MTCETWDTAISDESPLELTPDSDGTLLQEPVGTPSDDQSKTSTEKTSWCVCVCVYERERDTE